MGLCSSGQKGNDYSGNKAFDFGKNHGTTCPRLAAPAYAHTYYVLLCQSAFRHRHNIAHADRQPILRIKVSSELYQSMPSLPLTQVIRRVFRLSESKDALEALNILARHLIIQDVRNLIREDLLSCRPFVNTHHGHSDRPRSVADTQAKV